MYLFFTQAGSKGLITSTDYVIIWNMGLFYAHIYGWNTTYMLQYSNGIDIYTRFDAIFCQVVLIMY